MVLKVASAAAMHQGLPLTGDLLKSLVFPAAFTLSMPFWLMKGQPWKAQVAIVGGTLALLGLIGYL